MTKIVLSHVLFGCLTGILSAVFTYLSRNGSASQPVKYLVIQVSDPSKPATVPEP